MASADSNAAKLSDIVSARMDKGRNVGLEFWLVVFALLLLTRIPAMEQYFSIDNVNLALSLEHFDPRVHQPQPPGYPLFVLSNKAVNVLFHNPQTTFRITGLVVTALCLPLLLGLGRRIFNDWTGYAAVWLLLLAPPFWYASLEGALRPNLALFSLLTAYCCWRCWNGEKSFALWGAVALGIGSGFRPDLGGFLFPLWLLSAWMGTRSIAAVVRGLALMAAIVLVWLGGMAYAVGGLQALYDLNRNYLVGQSQARSWSRQISRLVVWNATAVVGVIWTVPFFLKARQRISLLSPQSVFLIVWVLPGLLFQALVHVEDPGHTLFSIPAFSLLAAYLLFVATQRMQQMREIFLSVALLVSALLFLGFFSLPATAEASGGLRSIKNAFLFSTFETSIEELRYQDNVARLTLAEIERSTPSNRPSIIVASDAGVRDWFLNWRIARYYLPARDIWVVADLATPHWIQHVRRDFTDLQAAGSNLKIPVPANGRILWLMERGGPFHHAVQQGVPMLADGVYVSYSDIAAGTAPFRILDVEFVPQGLN